MGLIRPPTHVEREHSRALGRMSAFERSWPKEDAGPRVSKKQVRLAYGALLTRSISVDTGVEGEVLLVSFWTWEYMQWRETVRQIVHDVCHIVWPAIRRPERPQAHAA